MPVKREAGMVVQGRDQVCGTEAGDGMASVVSGFTSDVASKRRFVLSSLQSLHIFAFSHIPQQILAITGSALRRCPHFRHRMERDVIYCELPTQTQRSSDATSGIVV